MLRRVPLVIEEEESPPGLHRRRRRICPRGDDVAAQAGAVGVRMDRAVTSGRPGPACRDEVGGGVVGAVGSQEPVVQVEQFAPRPPTPDAPPRIPEEYEAARLR